MSALPPKDYMYDTKEENGKIVSKTIFIQKEGLLDKHLKYDFAYNNDGKVSEKTVCRWSNISTEWEPFYKITYQYEKETGNITSAYGIWNQSTHDYSLNKQVILLTADNYDDIFS
jgi:hypothetical protein